ncbi:hypothetical protein [Alishewanella longhuensis]
MKIKVSFLIASLLASASCFAGEKFQVSSFVFTNGELVASPVLVVEEGKTAQVSSEGFNFSVNVKQEDNTAVLLNLVSNNAEFERNTSVIFQIGEKLQLELGEQSFEFLITKVTN